MRITHIGELYLKVRLCFQKWLIKYVHFIVFTQVVYERQPTQPSLKGGLKIRIPGTPRSPAGRAFFGRRPCTLIKAFRDLFFSQVQHAYAAGARGIPASIYLISPPSGGVRGGWPYNELMDTSDQPLLRT